MIYWHGEIYTNFSSLELACSLALASNGKINSFSPLIIHHEANEGYTKCIQKMVCKELRSSTLPFPLLRSFIHSFFLTTRPYCCWAAPFSRFSLNPRWEEEEDGVRKLWAKGEEREREKRQEIICWHEKFILKTHFSECESCLNFLTASLLRRTSNAFW